MNLVRETRLVDRYQRELREAFAASTVRRIRTIVAARLTEPGRAVLWDKANRVWGYLDKPREQSRYWNAFGISDPEESDVVVNIVQINPSRVGHLNTGGAFIADQGSGSVFLAHSGKIGGESVGEAAAFLSEFETLTLNVDNKKRRYVIISDIEDPLLNARIASFVQTCARFKAGKSRPHKDAKSGQLAGDEYDGKIEYRRRGYVRTRRVHGLLYKALRVELEKRGLAGVGRDVSRDLFCNNVSGKILFEIKTGSDTTSLYTAVGQLMLHGRAEGFAHCILVCPSVETRDRKRLRALKLGVICYDLDGDKVHFSDLDSAISKIVATRGRS